MENKGTEPRNKKLSRMVINCTKKRKQSKRLVSDRAGKGHLDAVVREVLLRR